VLHRKKDSQSAPALYSLSKQESWPHSMLIAVFSKILEFVRVVEERQANMQTSHLSFETADSLS
jgi:hypothetical protein